MFPIPHGTMRGIGYVAQGGPSELIIGPAIETPLLFTQHACKYYFDH